MRPSLRILLFRGIHRKSDLCFSAPVRQLIFFVCLLYHYGKARYLSLVFQSYNLIDYLTPLENVKLGGKGDPKALLGSMGIGEEYWNRSVLQLSGGQQQRVAIARALASDAKVLLADEPTGNLDEATAWDVIDLLKHIAHEEKKCVIVVTHSKELAQAADEVIHIGGSTKPNF